jgi:HlyD family secretion protein
MKKKILWIGIPVLVVAAGAAAMALRKPDAGQLGVEVEPTERREVIETVNAIGRIQPVVQVDISADVSAKITRLPVVEGQWVERGQLLVELDRERYVAEVESAEANLRAAQANARLATENLNRAEKDHQRIRELQEQSLESESSLDTVYATMEVERARLSSAGDGIEQARAALKQARDALSKTTIYAPMAGTVSKLNKEQGEIALGSQFQSDVIMVVSNLEGMEALVDVDENDVVSVSVGDRATIEVDALSGREFQGVVTEIANSAKVAAEGTSDQKTEFEVKIAIENPSADLRPGMTASADVVTEVREAALAVPIQSVAVRTRQQIAGDGSNGGEDGEGGEGVEGGAGKGPDGAAEAPELALEPDADGFAEVVWVVADGRALARQVKTGIQSDSHIEILDGLDEGEAVVVGNYRAISKDLTHGAAVTTEGDPGAPAPADRVAHGG